MKNNHRTVFTQAIADGETLDASTARLIQYCYCAPAYRKFSYDYQIVSGVQSGVTLAHYMHVMTMAFSVVLVLEAASRLPQYYSSEFYHELSTLSPLILDDLKMIRIEQRLWDTIRDQ